MGIWTPWGGAGYRRVGTSKTSSLILGIPFPHSVTKVLVTIYQHS